MTVTIDGTSGITYPAGTIQGTGYGPAFSAYRNATQSISSATFTKVQLNNENFDTANCFDSTTNYRFTPNVAGYYQISASIYLLASAAFNSGGVAIYKNGSNYSWGTYGSFTSSDFVHSVSQVVYMNGSTDYIEIYSYCTFVSGTASIGGAVANLCTASGSLIRGA